MRISLMSQTNLTNYIYLDRFVSKIDMRIALIAIGILAGIGIGVCMALLYMRWQGFTANPKLEEKIESSISDQEIPIPYLEKKAEPSNPFELPAYLIRNYEPDAPDYGYREAVGVEGRGWVRDLIQNFVNANPSCPIEKILSDEYTAVDFCAHLFIYECIMNIAPPEDIIPHRFHPYRKYQGLLNFNIRRTDPWNEIPECRETFLKLSPEIQNETREFYRHRYLLMTPGKTPSPEQADAFFEVITELLNLLKHPNDKNFYFIAVKYLRMGGRAL